MRAPRDLLGTIGRLIAAGIVASSTYDPATDTGELHWTPAMLKLLLAGRRVEGEPGFQRAWATGDPRVVRAWIEREAAAIGDVPGGDVGDGGASASQGRGT